MRVLVTGAAGFIGRRVCELLVERGDEVVGVDAMIDQAEGYWPFGLSGAYECVSKFTPSDDLRWADAIVHLAALVGVGQSQYEIGKYVDMNTLDTAEFLERVVEARPKRLIVASSMSVYGEGEYACPVHGHRIVHPAPRSALALRDCVETGEWDPRCPFGTERLQHRPTPETKRLQPASVYAITKRDQEELALVLGEAYDIPTLALRFGNVYGTGQASNNPYTGAIAIFASRAANGLAPIVYEDGGQLRDFTHRDDIARGILAAIDSDARGEAINLGTGTATPILDVARHISACFSAPSPELPGEGRAGDIRHCYLSVERARKMLGFEAEIPLVVGLNEYIVDLVPAALRAPDSEGAAEELRGRGLLR